MISDVFYVWTGKIAYVLLGILASSIAGTLSYLVWLFLEKETAKFHVRVAMQFLRMILACFLIPIIPFVIDIFEKGLELSGEILLIPTYMGIILVVVVPVCLFAFVAISITKYWDYRKKLFLCRDNVPITDEKYCNLLEKWCKKLGIRKKVQLSFNAYIKSPAILYYKGYQIVMPTYIKDERVFNIALLHELVHLKHGDLSTKQIGAVANVLHAFNPYIYRLRRDIEKWAEVDCDKATCEFGKEEFSRQEYFDCIMDLKERSQNPSEVKEICGLVENQDLVTFRVDTMLELERNEMKTPLTGYVVTLFFLVVLTVGSFKVSYTVYELWVDLLVEFQHEKADDSSPEDSTIGIFAGTQLVYSDEKILNRDDSLNFFMGPKETWIFDVSEENVNTVVISIMCGSGHFEAGGIGEDGKVVSMECDEALADWLIMNNGAIQQIFVQNPGAKPIEVELLALTDYQQ